MGRPHSLRTECRYHHRLRHHGVPEARPPSCSNPWYTGASTGYGDSQTDYTEAIVKGPGAGGHSPAEEHNILGGLGGAVAEVLVETHPYLWRGWGQGCFWPIGKTG